MARQVAHDIKNPLTPIQLSAEHARRVNIDRGRPLSPVLDDCVQAILTQVSLLRQISSEFSSFASSPTARPEPTSLPAIIEEVVAPYRTGLAGRIAIDVEMPDGLPPAQIDRTLFARAITNVIENALHAMPGQGRLTIRAASRPPVIVIDLIDTGVGMDARRARAHVRTLLLHEGDRHRPWPDHRQTEHRIDRRNDQPEQHEGRRHDGLHDGAHRESGHLVIWSLLIAESIEMTER